MVSTLEYRIEYQIMPIYEEYIKDGIIKREGLNKFGEIIREFFREDNKFLMDLGYEKVEAKS